MTAAPRLGILGGTLDPVHTGHIEAALAARRQLGLDRVLLMPARVPPHRPAQPSASGYQRFAMAALAIQNLEGLEISDLELRAPGTSYTSDTLERLHGLGCAASQIFFITGADAFAEIETWHRYPEVVDMANFVVVSRPGYDPRALASRLPALADRMVDGTRQARPAAGVAIFLVNAATPDVSSTGIRRRLAAGEAITGLVPAAVEAHIHRHRLYTAGDAAYGGTTLRPAADHLHGED